MKKLFALMIVSMFMFSLVFAATNQTVTSASLSSNSNDSEDSNATIPNSERVQEATQQAQAQITQAQGELSEYRARVVQRIQNQLRANADPGNCPTDCVCQGAVTRCQYQEGREMTIRAGNSGNTIVQVKNQNMSTKVELYKAEGKIYGVFGDKTKEVKYLPDEVPEKVRDRIQKRIQNYTMELDENGTYQIQARKQARLFGVIPVKEKVQLEMNAETGEITRVRNPWWGFLARDIEAETQETE
ncbi:hypothetical protein K9L16_00780 [Candidatus Pacearchaeota archaeon]|nr:hypothetical protein [Candidatus Pacearchaeota archaeon]